MDVSVGPADGKSHANSAKVEKALQDIQDILSNGSVPGVKPGQGCPYLMSTNASSTDPDLRLSSTKALDECQQGGTHILLQVHTIGLLVDILNDFFYVPVSGRRGPDRGTK